MQQREADRSPLGARWDGAGVDFVAFSAHATAIDLCLFERGGSIESARLSMRRGSGAEWRCRVEGVGPGLLYGLRAYGPWQPEAGHLFDPTRLLVDPRAGAVDGAVHWSPALRADAAPGTNTAPWVPRAVVVDPAFDWGGDVRPRTPWSRTVVYEAHVRGLTKRHPDVPPALRGTWLGLASEPVIEHLKSLGVTAIEVLPAAHHAPERRLLERGATNSWGYSPLAFLAPHAGHATPGGDAGRELRQAVRALHAAGLEVIVDACLGHTVEGALHDLTLSLRGLDNASYYRLRPDGQPADWTGCGNTIDAGDPLALGLVLDALRWWATSFRVDGFRLDQGVVLGRGEDGAFSPDAPFFRAVAADPVLRDLKWIAEPWDLGPDGYRLGGFPEPFVEWNDRFRGAARSAWRGDRGVLPELATRLAGSSDLFGARGPLASVSFVTCHDGFTLRDLVSYERKRNQANGEDGRDGSDDNRSCGWGADGPTTDPGVLRRRLRAAKNLLATVAFSQGVPMLLHGDELGRTQRGNNNAYCHDSELTWVDWDLDDAGRELLELARRALALRRDHPVLRRERFFSGERVGPGDRPDVTWLAPDGREMSPEDWADPSRRALAARLVDGESDLLLLLSCGPHAVGFRLPDGPPPGEWVELLGTAREHPARALGEHLRLPGFALTLLAWRPR